MNIIFLLPVTTEKPCGGIKVIFEYANRFAKDGNSVTCVMPAVLLSFKNKIAGIYRYPYHYLTKNYYPYKWFDLDRRVKLIYVPSLKQKYIPFGDVYVATAVETAYFLNDYKTSAKKIYFIQDFEDWSMTAVEVRKSYTFSMKKIVISPWLQKEVLRMGSAVELIPNGFDFDYFHITNSIESRNRFSVLMLYHKEERKRCCDAIAALKIVKEKYPDLKVTMFGVPKKPKEIKFDFFYFQKPDRDTHNMIYNDAAIFITASRKEGMALPPAEAMQCGCAVCCTNIGGFELYAKDGYSALLSPVFDYNALANNIMKLIEDNNLRLQIAKQGNELIHGYTWEKAYMNFKKVVCAE